MRVGRGHRANDAELTGGQQCALGRFEEAFVVLSALARQRARLAVRAATLVVDTVELRVAARAAVALTAGITHHTLGVVKRTVTHERVALTAVGTHATAATLTAGLAIDVARRLQARAVGAHQTSRTARRIRATTRATG